MSWFKKSLVFLLILIGAAVSWVIVYYTADDVANISQTLDISSKTRFIRWAVIGSIIIFWSEIIQFLGRKKLSAEQVDRAKAMHWRVALALIAFEAIVVGSAFQYLV